VEKQEKKAAKKARRRARAAGEATIKEEGNSTGTEDDDKKETLQLVKLKMQMEIAKHVENKVSYQDGSASVSGYTPAPPRPPMWTPEEEEYIRKKATKDLKRGAVAAGADGKGIPVSGEPEPDADAKTSPGGWNCSKCGEKVFGVQNFKLLSMDGNFIDTEWRDRMWGVCFGCSGDDDLKTFKKLARESHNCRKDAVEGRAKRVREVVFGQSKDKLALEFPHLSNTQLRKLAGERVSMMVVALGASFLRMSKPVQDVVTKITKDYILDVQHATDNPSEASRVSQGPIIGYTATTHLTQVMENLWLSWVCRACKWFGFNHQWIRHADKEWYRCPNCGVKYQPFVMNPGWTACQKALTIRNPINGECQSFGCDWPAGAEDNWLSRMVELRARELNAPQGGDLTEYLCSAAVELSDLLKKVSAPASWRRFDWKYEVEAKLDERTYPEKNWGHLRAGYTGDMLSEAGAATPFREWEQLISCFARTVVGAAAKLGVEVP
jgi:hypothetical protein